VKKSKENSTFKDVDVLIYNKNKTIDQFLPALYSNCSSISSRKDSKHLITWSF
jgi:hypothetical protein